MQNLKQHRSFVYSLQGKMKRVLLINLSQILRQQNTLSYGTIEIEKQYIILFILTNQVVYIKHYGKASSLLKELAKLWSP